MSTRVARSRGCPLPIVAALVVSWLLAIGQAYAAKDDVVLMRNGDELTGELKRLERGMLYFKTDATDTIQIEWDEVVGLRSSQHVEVETTLGEDFFGGVKPASAPGKLRLEGFDTSLELDFSEIVRITPIDNRYLDRIDGSVSLGYSYTQSSDVATFNLSADATYQTRTYLYGFRLNSNLTRQETGDSSQQDFELRYQLFMKNRWFAEWTPQLQKNEDLGIDLRVLIPVAFGRELIQNNHLLFSLAGGLAYNEEYLADADESTSSVEALAGTRLELFHYDYPRTDLVTLLRIYPSLTESGRVRASLNISLRWELFKDFFLQLNLNDNYDNKPEAEDARQNDVVLSTSFGWTF